MLESAQRRATRSPSGFLSPSYDERLTIMGLPTLADRRTRGDLIVTFRALHDSFGVDMRHLFILNSDGRLRAHEFKLKR